MPKKSLRSSKGGVSIPGQVERRLERAAAVWKRRCQGATYSTLVAEFGISKTCVHNYIEDARALLREEIHDLAARERAVAVELLDNAIEKIVPHINGQIGMPHCVHVMQSIRRVKLATFLSVTATLVPRLVRGLPAI